MYRVLVVEDNDKIRLELCDFLSKNGYAADSCTNFEHIMEEIKAKRPDLILLDLGLPFVDGHFICKELRRTSNVPIIIRSTTARIMKRPKGLRAIFSAMIFPFRLRL